jgi:hypothetical protein
VLLRAVEREIDHLVLTARRGTLNGLEPLAIPHGPLLANLRALRSDLGDSSTPSAADPPRPAPAYTPINVDLMDAPVELPRCSAAERIVRARRRRVTAARDSTRLLVPGPSLPPDQID